MNPTRTPFDERAPRWLQPLLKLTRTFTLDQRRRLVCIPDRMSAENERDKLQRQHGPALTNAKLSKNGKGKDATWTVSYTLSEQRTEDLF
jgi:hypothetical protein